MSAFAKCWVSGPGAEAWLDSILANRIPKKVGRIALCHLLTRNGGVRSEFTVYRQPGGFYLVSAGAYEAHDHDVLQKLLPGDGKRQGCSRSPRQWGVWSSLARNNSRGCCFARLTRASLENADFPWLSGKQISVGAATAHALRVNFVGELGWELHHPVEQQNYIFDRLMDAGQEFGIKPFGTRAMTAMAIEKSYRLIPRELSIEYSAWESGLDRFVHPNTGDFIGRDALVRLREAGPKWACATLEVHGVTDADARGNEAIYRDGKLVGRATNGGYGWRCGKSLALAMVAPDCAATGTQLDIKLLGKLHAATVIEESPFDPENRTLRS